MTETESYMNRLEDVLESMGLRTFDSPMTLDYRFGSFQPEVGRFRCFVNVDDVIQSNEYLEMKSNRVYWIALEYPDRETVMENIRQIGQQCFKVLGRIHTAYFILALETGLSDSEREALSAHFLNYQRTLSAGTYHILEVWDEGVVRAKE